MAKQNQTLTEGIIGQVPEMEITWSLQSSKVLVKLSFMIHKIIRQKYKKRKRSLSCAWIDYKKAFDSVFHKWILKSLELSKVSRSVTDFLKLNMKKWKTQLTLTQESGTLMSDYINIKKGIFRGDPLFPRLFSISLILELNSSGYRYKIGTE